MCVRDCVRMEYVCERDCVCVGNTIRMFEIKLSFDKIPSI